jgi:hypothetical protein
LDDTKEVDQQQLENAEVLLGDHGNFFASGGGVIDGGGGNIGTTPVEEVVGIIEEILEASRKKNPFLNLTMRAAMSPNVPSGLSASLITPYLDEMKAWSEKVEQCDEQYEDDYELWDQNCSSIFEQLVEIMDLNSLGLAGLLDQSKVEIRTDDFCYDKTGAKTDGSVSDFTVDAKICLSAYSISRLPKSSVHKQTLALLTHEVSHLVGFNEEDAHKVQEAVLDHYLVIMNGDIEQDKQSLAWQFATVDMVLTNTGSPNWIDPAKYQLNAIKGISFFRGQLYVLSQLLPRPSALPFSAMIPARPELETEARNAVARLDNAAYQLLAEVEQLSGQEIYRKIKELKEQSKELSIFIEHYLLEVPHIIRN